MSHAWLRISPFTRVSNLSVLIFFFLHLFPVCHGWLSWFLVFPSSLPRVSYLTSDLLVFSKCTFLYNIHRLNYLFLLSYYLTFLLTLIHKFTPLFTIFTVILSSFAWSCSLCSILYLIYKLYNPLLLIYIFPIVFKPNLKVSTPFTYNPLLFITPYLPFLI